MFKKYLVLALAGVLSAGAAMADGDDDDNKQGSNCSSVDGTVKLTPDPQCGIVAAYPGPIYLAFLPNTCFSVVVKGKLQGSGFSGLTTETLLSQLGGSAQTPASLNESGAPAINGMIRQVLTARSSLKVSGGTIRTADAILDANGAVVEQLLITGGDGAYQGATGTVLVLGDSIGNKARYQGTICKAK